jgi:hypothetical protein
MKLLVAVLTLVCILDVAPVVFGGSCFPAHIQQTFCKSQFGKTIWYLRNNSWKPEFVYSFNMGNINFVIFYPER